MRKIAGLIALAVFTSAAFAHENSEEHVAHLRMMIKEMSQHGAVIPQPASIIDPQAAKTIAITARSFSFSPSSFTVNQGDVVTLTVNVPPGDGSVIGHGVLMDTYVEGGLDCPRGQTVSVTFTATTPGTFAWVCTQPDCGTGHTSMFGQMIVTAGPPAPVVTSVTPNSGSTAGGTPVIIAGSNFQTTGETVVRFDTSLATQVSVLDASTISARTPAHSEQTVGVRVTNPDGQVGTLPQAYTFITPGVRISSVSPATGSTAGGTNITITGVNFLTGATVTVGGLAATNVNVVNPTSITATTPLGPANEQVSQPQDIVVTNTDGTSGTLARAFTYFVPPLSVSAISPAVGVIGGGTVVTITGTGFTSAVLSSITFGGVPATSVGVVNAVTMQATAPAHAAGVVDVVVTVGGLSTTKTGAFTYESVQPRRRSVKHP